MNEWASTPRDKHINTSIEASYVLSYLADARIRPLLKMIVDPDTLTHHIPMSRPPFTSIVSVIMLERQ